MDRTGPNTSSCAIRMVLVTSAMIVGPAGIGKSRLAWEFLKYIDGLQETAWWHDGRSPAYGEGISFWALGEMVRERCQLAETDDEATTSSKVGETVRLPSGVSFTAGGSQQSSVTPEDIGVILNVTPSINPEGFVRMQIEPEISRLSLQTTQISEDFKSPVVTRRQIGRAHV